MNWYRGSKPRIDGTAGSESSRVCEVCRSGPEAVGEAQDGDDLVRVALGEGRDGALGLDDVALDRRARRVRPRHLLGEVRRVVLLAAVVVRGGLEDDLAHGRVRRRRTRRGCSSSR